MQSRRLVAVLCLTTLLTIGSTLAQETTETPTEETAANLTTYTVQRGDTLVSIANRFGTTAQAIADENDITNAALIYVGQELRIRTTISPTPSPSVTPTPTFTPTSTPTATTTPLAPQGTTTYTITAQDTLQRIANRFNTTVAELVELNNLTNPDRIFVGQELIVPGAPSTQPTPTVIPGVAVTANAAVSQTPIANTTVSTGFGYGITAFLNAQNVSEIAPQLTDLNINWVAVPIAWRDYEPAPGEIDFASLDHIVDTLKAQNLNILFTVSDSPDWSRSTTGESGPPDDLTDFATFMGALAERYAGRVAAYEIWSEPNLRQNWNSTVHPINPLSYLELLAASYEAIKAADPTAIVVSAGLAPITLEQAVETTGENIANDRLYLEALYLGGLADISDAIGVHPAGFANPPDARCCEPAAGVRSHYEEKTFYFLETLSDYRNIMVANDDSETPLWVTEFGWATGEGSGEPPETYNFIRYTSLDEQAIYIPRAYEIGAELGYIGPMFLYNFNGCQIVSSTACYFSLIDTNGQTRPIYTAIQAITNGELMIPVVQPTAESTEAGG